MISAIAGVTPNKPAHASLPLPGIQPVIVDANGKELTGNNVEGNLCIKFPWPGIARTIWGDHQRYKDTYFSTFPGKYFTGEKISLASCLILFGFIGVSLFFAWKRKG